MTTAASSLATTSVDVAGLPLPYAEAGAGDPLLVLPHETGTMSGAEFRELLAKKMTPAQVAKGQRLAREWKPTN